MLKADIQLRLSRLDLDAAFTVESGEVVALLGPNGSGKSTTLRALMGLLPLAGGQVVLDGTVLEDPAQHIKVPPENRPIGLMFQDYLLFPHLSAVENVAFGLRAKGTDKKQARDRATQALERLGLEGALTSARPGAMSGGQQQRVAMARALVTEPKLLLLDEPLAALDVSTKTDVRRLLREALRQSEAANVLVTHDLLDAVALGDRMVVIGDGKIGADRDARRGDIAPPLPLRRRSGRRQPAARHRPWHGAGRRRRRADRHHQRRERGCPRHRLADRGGGIPATARRAGAEHLGGADQRGRPHGRPGPGSHRRTARDHGRGDAPSGR